MDVIEGAVAVGGPLLGVLVGGWLTQLQHVRERRNEQGRQLRAERLAVYGRLISAGRSWQSTVLEPSVKIVTAHTGVPYADAGDSYGDTIRALAELRLVAGDPATVTAAQQWEHALRELSNERAARHPDAVPDDAIELARSREIEFVTAARKELATPAGRRS